MSSKISIHAFLSSVGKKLSFFDENITGFFSIMHFTGNQMAQGPTDSFRIQTANGSKGFKPFQTIK